MNDHDHDAQSTTKPKPRGFAAMSPEQRRAFGSKGGRVAHERGTANTFTSETASAAGRIPHVRGTAYHWTSEEAREAARKGRGVPRPRRRRTEPH
ncbi:MAG: hypothetical protein HYV09_13495 [Deltaproteobacteria bacterium]|nr:hypothetical protein [Deltaproteobacteria bacterium]